MRTILSTLGICAALVMCAVSASMNYLFMASLGKTLLEGLVLGAASVAADILKALLPFYIAWSWQARRVIAACAGSLAFAFIAAFSFLSALGFAADNRGTLTESRGAITAAYERVQREAGNAETQASRLPAHRPAAVVTEEIERHKQNSRWSRSKSCSDTTEPLSREFCAAYFALRAELATGQEAARLASAIAALQSQATKLRESGAGQNPDPQVSLLARIFGQAPEPVRLTLTIAVALLVEIGASLGLFLASGHAERPKAAAPNPPQEEPPPLLPAPRPTGSVEDFCLEALVPAKGGALELSDLFPAYQAWCAERGFAALEEPEFTATFEQLAQGVGLRLKAGRYSGIALASEQMKERKAA